MKIPEKQVETEIPINEDKIKIASLAKENIELSQALHLIIEGLRHAGEGEFFEFCLPCIVEDDVKHLINNFAFLTQIKRQVTIKTDNIEDASLEWKKQKAEVLKGLDFLADHISKRKTNSKWKTDIIEPLSAFTPCPPKPKTLHNSTISQAKDNVKDLQVVGNGDAFRLLCKASSKAEGWLKSTKAMEIKDSGCLVQVTTQQRNPDGSYAVAEALTFVPHVAIVEDVNGGRKLVDNALE